MFRQIHRWTYQDPKENIFEFVAESSVPLFDAQCTSSGDTNDDVIIVEQSLTTKALGTKKQKNISRQPTLIDKFVDHSMTTLHQRTADIKLF